MSAKKMTLADHEALATRSGECLISHRKAGMARRIYEMRHGKIASSKICVCHTCDNPRCILDAHHFLGTATDNMRDCVNKGRYTSHTGKKRSEETRRKLSSSQKGNHNGKGKCRSEETKMHMSEAGKKRWNRERASGRPLRRGGTK